MEKLYIMIFPLLPVSYTHLAIRHGGDGKYISLRLTTSNGKNIIEIEDRGDGDVYKRQGYLCRCVATGENEILQILPVSEQSSCK